MVLTQKKSTTKYTNFSNVITALESILLFILINNKSNKIQFKHWQGFSFYLFFLELYIKHGNNEIHLVCLTYMQIP